MIIKPNCRFCNGELESGGSQTGGGYNYTKLIYHCKNCSSQQMYKYDATPLEFHFYIPTNKGYSYYVAFDPESSWLHIARVYDWSHPDRGNGMGWKVILEIKLQSFPTWLAPKNMTEHRIQTMMVFS